MLGQHNVYEGNISVVTVPIIHPIGNQVRLQVNYQGCSAFGYCYPPMQATLSLDLTQPNVSVQAKAIPQVFGVEY